MSDIDSALQGNSFPTNEEEVFTLRKQVLFPQLLFLILQLRMQEAEWKKNKAVLEQRIEILELQNRDLKEKEESLKKMNNSIVGAFKDFNKENDPTSVSLFMKFSNIQKNHRPKSSVSSKSPNSKSLKIIPTTRSELKRS